MAFFTIMVLTHLPYMAMSLLLIVELVRLRGRLRAIRMSLEEEDGQYR